MPVVLRPSSPLCEIHPGFVFFCPSSTLSVFYLLCLCLREGVDLGSLPCHLPVPDELILHHFKVVAGFQSYLDQTTLFPSLLRGESFPKIEKYFCVDFTFLPGPWAIITPFFVFVFVLV